MSDNASGWGHASAGLNQILAVGLGVEEYGIDILRVQEITGFGSVTPIPGTPIHILGVMNLRGTIVPVIDLRQRFGLPARAADKFTVVVVVMVASRVVGLVVDGVSDVVSITPDSIQPLPDFDIAVEQTFLTGLVRQEERLIALVDIDRVVGTLAADVLTASNSTTSTATAVAAPAHAA